MARQNKTWPWHRPQWASARTFAFMMAAVATVLALAIVLGNLEGPSALISKLMCAAGREALELLPSVVSAAWQAVHPYAFDDGGASACPVEILVSFLPLFRAVANVSGAA